MVAFSAILRYWLGRRSLGDERQTNRWEEIVSRFKGTLVKMIKDVNARFDDYSVSSKIRQILLHCGYKLVESDLLSFIYLCVIIGLIKRSYYKKQKKDIIRVVLKKAAEYYLKKKRGRGSLKENANNKYRSLSEKEKEAKREY